MARAASANTGKRRRTCTEYRRRPAEQIELFGGKLPAALIDIPAWRDLPAATQAVLTSLMTQLILDHAETRPAGPVAAGSGHDL